MPVPRNRSVAPRPLATTRGGLATTALVLGALGAVCVAAAIGLSVVTPLPLGGLALASGGVVLTLAGLLLGTIDATRGPVRGNRRAVLAAGVSVAGLAGGLIWLAAFVITAVAGPAPTTTVQPQTGTETCAPSSCAAD